MKLSKTAIMALALASGAVASTAIAATIAETIAARQANFKQMGRGFKGIMDELKKPEPGVQVIRDNADILARSARRIHGLFPRGSGAESGVKTVALPAIWARPRDFRDAARNMERAAGALQVAARRGDLAVIRTAAGAIGGNCKACHDSFKGHE